MVATYCDYANMVTYHEQRGRNMRRAVVTDKSDRRLSDDEMGAFERLAWIQQRLGGANPMISYMAAMLIEEIRENGAGPDQFTLSAGTCDGLNAST